MIIVVFEIRRRKLINRYAQCWIVRRTILNAMKCHTDDLEMGCFGGLSNREDEV